MGTLSGAHGVAALPALPALRASWIRSLVAISWITWMAALPPGWGTAQAREESPSRLFTIEIVERGTGWPVPMVELRTTHLTRWVSDNAGVIALDAPELFGREVWFDLIGHGYEVARDGFGFRGVRLRPMAGGHARVEVTRAIIAKRLGRLTGAGIFGESQKLGREKEWVESGVFGCDSVQNAVYQGRLFWAWGDTTLPHYPLGIFEMTSAATEVRPLERFEPPVRLHFGYFTNAAGRPRGVAPMPGEGPTWVTGYASLPDKNGRQRLVGSYVKIKPPLEAYRAGLCVWNDETRAFESVRELWTKSDSEPKQPPFPEGHPAFYTDAGGVAWILFGNPFPTLRCRATYEAWEDPAQWETIEPQRSLAAARTGAPVRPHSGSIAWHSWRGRWVTVFMESFGKPSAFGELWYAEAEAPTGPWGPAIKILSHENYTFYNPRIHPEFTPPNSPVLLFEGTFTQQFADKPAAAPRHDYNQVLYRLDLDDPSLQPALTPAARP